MLQVHQHLVEFFLFLNIGINHRCIIFLVILYNQIQRNIDLLKKNFINHYQTIKLNKLNEYKIDVRKWKIYLFSSHIEYYNIQVGIVNMKLIRMILLRDMVQAPNNGYFMVKNCLFSHANFIFEHIIGCKSQSIEAIINDCFNRSHAVRCGE
jgi:hypothetical protein